MVYLSDYTYIKHYDEQGKLHMVDKPAVIRSDGYIMFYTHDVLNRA